MYYQLKKNPITGLDRP